MEVISEDPHHMHKAYFHHVVDYGAENGWITNLCFIKIRETIEAEEWGIVRVW